MSPKPSPISVVAAPPIDSLKELRRQNSALLQRNVAGEGTAKPTAGELLGFLESASKLGSSLSREDERETAQGIMDVWIAELLSIDPHAGNTTRPFTLADEDDRSASLVSDQARNLRVEAGKAVQRADDILPTPPPMGSLKKPMLTRVVESIPTWMQPIAFKVAGDSDESNVLKQLLLRFVRLKEKSLEPYSVALPTDDDILREPKAKELLDRLIKAGVVKQQEVTGNAPVSYVLAHESLLTKWPLLVEVITLRRAFREITNGWENGGRPPAALLHSGPQLEQAIDLPYLDASEQAFLEASRRAGENNRKWALSVMSTALAGLVGIVVFLFITKNELRREKANVEHQLGISRTSVSVLKSIQELLGLQSAVANNMAERISAKAASNLSKPQEADQHRGDVEVFIPIDCDPDFASSIVDGLEAKGYNVVAGIALPRKRPGASKEPGQPAEINDLCTIRTFREADRPLATKVAKDLAPLIAAVMPIGNVNATLGAQFDPAQPPDARRQLLAALPIPGEVFYFDPDNDESAPKGFVQIFIDGEALPKP